MAITNNGVVYTGKAAKDANSVGFTPTGSSFSDWNYQSNIQATFSVDKSTVEDPVALNTFTALDSDIGDYEVVLGAHFDATNTVDTYIEVRNIELETDPKYTDSATNYVCTLVFYSKVV